MIVSILFSRLICHHWFPKMSRFCSHTHTSLVVQSIFDLSQLLLQGNDDGHIQHLLLNILTLVQFHLNAKAWNFFLSFHTFSFAFLSLNLHHYTFPRIQRWSSPASPPPPHLYPEQLSLPACRLKVIGLRPVLLLQIPHLFRSARASCTTSGEPVRT